MLCLQQDLRQLQEAGPLQSGVQVSVKINATEDGSKQEASLGVLGMLPSYSGGSEGSPKTGPQGSRQIHKIKLQPNQATISHIESMKGKWHRTRPNKHPNIVADATLCLEGYCTIV